MGTVKSRATTAVRAPSKFVAAVARGDNVLDAARSCCKNDENSNSNVNSNNNSSNNNTNNKPAVSAAVAAALAAASASGSSTSACCAGSRDSTSLSTVRSLSELLDPERRRKAKSRSRRRNKGEGEGLRVLLHDNSNGRGFLGVGWDVANHFQAITEYFDHVIAVTSWQQAAEELEHVLSGAADDKNNNNNSQHHHNHANSNRSSNNNTNNNRSSNNNNNNNNNSNNNNTNNTNTHNNNNNTNNSTTTTPSTSTRKHKIAELQIWVRSAPGKLHLGMQNDDSTSTSSTGQTDTLSASTLPLLPEWQGLRDMFEDNALLWLRGSRTLQGAEGVALADALAAHFNNAVRVAGHTADIHAVHRGLVVRPAGAAAAAAAAVAGGGAAAAGGAAVLPSWADESTAEWCLASDMAMMK